MKNFLKMICDGFDSICQGFDSIVRAPFIHDIFPRHIESKKFDLPKTDEEAFERDRKALEDDWKKIIKF